METLKVELDQAEDERNIFERLFRLIERHSLSFDENKIDLGNFYDVVTQFDKEFQKFNHEQKGINLDLYNELLVDTFSPFLKIFEITGFSDEPIFYAFKKFISYFSYILKASSNLKLSRDVYANFYTQFPSFKAISNEKRALEALKDIFGKDHNLPRSILHWAPEAIHTDVNKELSKFKMDFPNDIGILYNNEEMGENIISDNRMFSVYVDNYKVNLLKWDNSQKYFSCEEESYYMLVQIETRVKNKTSSELFKPFWIISSVLENIDGVETSIEEITVGSLVARIRIFFKTLLSKEETKAVLETAKEAVSQNLVGVSYIEAKKSLVDTAKTKVEIVAIEETLKRLPSEEENKQQMTLTLEKQTLENKRLAQEVEGKKLENAKSKLELIDKLSDLAAKGILEADMIKIDINEILYILKSAEANEIGPAIGEITGED